MSELELVELGEVSKATRGLLQYVYMEFGQGICKTKPIGPDDEWC